jgi:transketolase
MNRRLVVTCEEGFLCGGLGAAVLEDLAQLGGAMPNVLNIGLTGFPHAGSYKYMLAQTGLDAEHIADRIMTKLNEF